MTGRPRTKVDRKDSSTASLAAGPSDFARRLDSELADAPDDDVRPITSVTQTRPSSSRLAGSASYDVVEQLLREAHGRLKKRMLCDPYWAKASG